MTWEALEMTEGGRYLAFDMTENRRDRKPKVAVFMGTRPEAIKMAPVIRALEGRPDIETVVVSTGQHNEMLRQVVELFDIRVDQELNVMRPDQSLAELTARLLERIDEALARLRPDLALVQGDTTTVLVAALACFYRRIPIGHVEAGLRTGNIWAPFPEEVNRSLASKMVTLHFAPTALARENLVKEEVDDGSIFVTGNTVIDALHLEVERQQGQREDEEIGTRLDRAIGGDWRQRRFVLVTGHRRENFGEGFREICEALAELAGRFQDLLFIYPVHLNPNVREPVNRRLGGLENVRLIEPQAYSEFVMLMRRCLLVLTDSGGVQEEAPGLGKPVLVMRETTERPEGVTAGTVRLVGVERGRIVSEVGRLITDPAEYERMATAVNPYGDGKAAPRIVEAIQRFFRG